MADISRADNGAVAGSRLPVARCPATPAPSALTPTSQPFRRSLTPWAIIDRLERLVCRQHGVRLTLETSVVLLEALRAYVANPKRDQQACIICMRWHARREPCDTLCRRCLDLGFELKCIMRGERDPFGDRGWCDGGHRVQHKGKNGEAQDPPLRGRRHWNGCGLQAR